MDDNQEDDNDVNPFTLMILEDDAEDQEQDTTSSIPSSPLLGKENQEYVLVSINDTISIRQIPSEGISFKLWPAANTLVNLLDSYSCNNKPDSTIPILGSLLNKRPLRILELGSGTGIVGIAAAATLGANVTVTDLPHVLPNMQFNIDANARVLKACGGTVDVAPLRWGVIEDMEAIGRDFDLIMASDVVYHDHLYEPLLQTLRYLLLGGDKKMEFLMSHLKRWKKESSFFKRANKFFHTEVIHNDAPLNGSRVGVALYRFVGKTWTFVPGVR